MVLRAVASGGRKPQRALAGRASAAACGSTQTGSSLAKQRPQAAAAGAAGARAQRFTPRVSLAPPDGLLLEVKGSLQLFGGAEESVPRCSKSSIARAGVESVLALAPTPLAALACARAGTRRASWIKRIS